ncbi:TetR family transcriptional regulator [Rhodococcus triatomae]|uniref:DNA-binding transcriptional regulator, AcrR family n=1 Tax=Rhodococcus triatomae TaxID=300028 RepID=A0A1G8QN54_9NOCA|nr:TetR family transcriptional regulator [Rhodococcus triatomae]QNG20619.1 TetR family transcriptional regulator [Rhodococcus triatomae]QNG23463.1 TetR family transcriptional regulator [Rhodococcus triatomae]SDJ06194.1 DNA-binding transcriptional regulator, AcrR family [Rhodococcus triatomae]
MTEASRTVMNRRRSAMRMDIAASAARLFLERGFDETSVEDIARGADISVRTFYRYCDAKEDTLTPIIASGIRDFVSYLADRPEDEPVEIAVHAAFVESLRQDRYAHIVSTRDLFVLLTSVPGMRARWMVAALDLTDELRPVIGARAGHDPQSLEARLLSHTLIGALTVALEHWVTCVSDEGAPRVEAAELAASALSVVRFARR